MAEIKKVAAHFGAEMCWKLTRKEATDLVALLVAQLAEEPLLGQQAGSAPTIRVGNERHHFVVENPKPVDVVPAWLTAPDVLLTVKESPRFEVTSLSIQQTSSSLVTLLVAFNSKQTYEFMDAGLAQGNEVFVKEGDPDGMAGNWNNATKLLFNVPDDWKVEQARWNYDRNAAVVTVAKKQKNGSVLRALPFAVTNDD